MSVPNTAQNTVHSTTCFTTSTYDSKILKNRHAIVNQNRDNMSSNTQQTTAHQTSWG